MSESLAYAVTCPTLIGREAQGNTMRQLLVRAQGGSGQTLLVAGEAGIGKTRLVKELALDAAQAGLSVVTARSFETDSAIPCALLGELLRSLMRRISPLALVQALGPNALEVAKMAPELAPLLPSTAPPLLGNAEPDKRRLFEGLLTALLLFPDDSSTAPALVIVEDAQWCDSTSLDFLLFLARRIVAYPLLLVITYRDNEAGAHLQGLLAMLDRERLAVEITLARLDKTQTESMVRAIFHLPRAAQDDFLSALYALTEGNPFFIEEILKSCVARGDFFQIEGKWRHKLLGDLQIPRTVQVAVNQRAGQLTPSSQQVLKIAAVIGQRFEFPLLHRVTGQDERTVIVQLKELIGAQLVVEESTDRFAFCHALTRQAVYLSLLGRERRALHRAVAEAMEQLPGRESRLSELAYHFYIAGEWNKTWQYARRAGERAQTLYAPRAVIEHFSHAIEAAKELTEWESVRESVQGAEQVDDSDLAPLYRGRGSAYETLGDFEAARVDFEQMLALARRRQNLHAEWQSLIDLGFLWTGRDFEQARDYFQQTLLVARTLDEPALLAQSLNRLGNCYVNNEQPYLGRHYHADALAIFQELGDTSGIAATLDLLGGATQLAGDPQQSTRYYDEAARLFRQLNEQRGLISTLTWLTFRGPIAINLLTPAAHLRRCGEVAQEAIQLAREIQWRAGEAFAMIAHGFTACGQGNYGEAITLLEQAIQLTQEIDHRWDIVAYIALATLYLELGIPSKAQELLTNAITLTAGHHIDFSFRMSTATLAAAYVAQEKPDEARQLLIAAFGEERKSFPPPTEPAPTMAQRLYWLVRAELALIEKMPSDALAIANHLLATIGGSLSSPQQTVARLLILRGDALYALQRPAEAEQDYQLALAAGTAQGASPLVWRLQQRLGEICKERGERAQATIHFDAARALIEELAATIPDPDVRHHFLGYALAQFPALPNLTPLRARKQLVDGLTAREVEIARLIRQGISDREIANTLSLSTRTVSTHVSNILAKLGYISRAQIAAWAVAKGLV